MTDQDHNDVRGSELSQFERNRFFYGKFMTARDMQAEQLYHVGKLSTLGRLVVGEGIVRGLQVPEVAEENGRLEVTVGPGAAIDGAGRLLVVENTITERLSPPSGDQIAVMLRYDEAVKDRVPVPESERSLDEACEYNRLLETVEIDYVELDEEETDRSKDLGSVSFPASSDVATDERSLLDVAGRYHRDHLGTDPVEDTDVYLGAFEQRSNGWEAVDAQTIRRPHVYTNDLLYDVLMSHVADHENPHGVSVEGVSEEVIEQLEDAKEMLEDVAAVSERLDRLETENTALERYVMFDSLEVKILAFRHVAREFRSGTAEDIVQRTRRLLREGVITGQQEYVEVIEGLYARERALRHEIRGDATGESFERYTEALDGLEQALEGFRAEESVIEVARAQKRLCRAAQTLSRG